MGSEIETLIELALNEDLSQKGDVTAQALIDQDAIGSINICTRQSGVVSGTEVATATFQKIDETLDIVWNLNDGERCNAGDVIGNVSGSLRSILTAERTVLNFLQHLSGVASHTRKFVDALDAIGSKTVVRDTRKTIPGYRLLEKRAVVHGGGQNHRMGLYDAFLVKDNHLLGSSLEQVVSKCRAFDPTLPLEVEVDNFDQLLVVSKLGPDLIMLDNFSSADVRKVVDMNIGIALEVSGGVTLETIGEYGSTGVKYIAVGAITHSSNALDIGFDLI